MIEEISYLIKKVYNLLKNVLNDQLNIKNEDLITSFITYCQSFLCDSKCYVMCIGVNLAQQLEVLQGGAKNRSLSEYKVFQPSTTSKARHFDEDQLPNLILCEHKIVFRNRIQNYDSHWLFFIKKYQLVNF